MDGPFQKSGWEERCWHLQGAQHLRGTTGLPGGVLPGVQVGPELAPGVPRAWPWLQPNGLYTGVRVRSAHQVH